MSTATQTEVEAATQSGRVRMGISDSWVLTRRNIQSAA